MGIQGKFWSRPDEDPGLMPLSAKGMGPNHGEMDERLRPSLIILAETKTVKVARFQALGRLGFDKIKFPQGSPFLLTTIYVIPHSDLRKKLWENLLRLSKGIFGPWSVIGDFNDVCAADERIGGRVASPNRMRWFQENVYDCGLKDLGSNGPRMTWKGPKLAGSARLYERLDRGLANDSFLQTFQESVFKVLPRTEFYDHNPIVLSVGGFKIFQEPRNHSSSRRCGCCTRTFLI
ncbi:hypothetical protein K1719_038380 [Acacia pycnantha]|nr:hypothetical protein K1719_038380 [Acacia pycnantha]